MAKVPDDERMIEILRRGGQATVDDWAWIKRYLDLADKCLAPGDEIPSEKPSGTIDDQKQTNAAADSEFKAPLTKKQSA